MSLWDCIHEATASKYTIEEQNISESVNTEILDEISEKIASVLTNEEFIMLQDECLSEGVFSKISMKFNDEHRDRAYESKIKEIIQQAANSKDLKKYNITISMDDSKFGTTQDDKIKIGFDVKVSGDLSKDQAIGKIIDIVKDNRATDSIKGFYIYKHSDSLMVKYHSDSLSDKKAAQQRNVQMANQRYALYNNMTGYR